MCRAYRKRAATCPDPRASKETPAISTRRRATADATAFTMSRPCPRRGVGKITKSSRLELALFQKSRLDLGQRQARFAATKTNNQSACASSGRRALLPGFSENTAGRCKQLKPIDRGRSRNHQLPGRSPARQNFRSFHRLGLCAIACERPGMAMSRLILWRLRQCRFTRSTESRRACPPPAASLWRRARNSSAASRWMEDANVWFDCVLRGDNEWITIGARTNIQDNSVLHTDMGYPLVIGAGLHHRP